MSISIALYTRRPVEKFTLFSHRANDSEQFNLSFYGMKLIYTGVGCSEIYLGKLYGSSVTGKKGRVVVCKIAYDECLTHHVETEATFYEGKLRYLQGIHVPVCHGYFSGDTPEGPKACLVLDYCCEPIQDTFSELSLSFKKAILKSALAIHDAGVATHDWAERNVLDYHGYPMIIDFDEARPHECKRKMPVVEGELSPRCADFGCSEIFRLVKKLRLWKPNQIRYLGAYHPIGLVVDPHDLAEKAPQSMPSEQAYKEAIKAIAEHENTCYPEEINVRKAATTEETQVALMETAPFAMNDAKDDGKEEDEVGEDDGIMDEKRTIPVCRKSETLYLYTWNVLFASIGD
ncbi:hypothetical protein EVG20_g4976 [Dentipellis fragilis]|uniref:Protein kinase domain-containing protein n=1 Tax=Dentipellis fragilis TaxID=205917 RepID=A0A4Y9YWK6_9AGAM|nr:hypothetical protein EVG20_g4976 [Dentipellis fragilis]